MPYLMALKALPWKLIGAAAAALAFIACLAALRMEQAQNGKLKAQLHECAEARKADSTARNVQKSETQERIKVVTRTVREADDRARQVENAPLPGACRSPPEVLQADL